MKINSLCNNFCKHPPPFSFAWPSSLEIILNCYRNTKFWMHVNQNFWDDTQNIIFMQVFYTWCFVYVIILEIFIPSASLLRSVCTHTLSNHKSCEVRLCDSKEERRSYLLKVRIPVDGLTGLQIPVPIIKGINQ